MDRKDAIRTSQGVLVFHWKVGVASIASLVLALAAVAVPPPTGVAPVNVPTGGFAIDGDLLANTSVAGVGDWLPHEGGTGGAVLDASGVPLNPTTTFHFVDLYGSSAD